MGYWRDLILANSLAVEEEQVITGDFPLWDLPVNTDTPYADETLSSFTPDSRFIIVGPDTIDGDVRAGVYTILDKQTMTLVSGRGDSTANVSGGYTIDWNVNSQNLSCTVGSNNERMWLNILRNIQNRDIRISATINGNNVSNKTIYFDVNCTYAPANFVINDLNDWMILKTAIKEGRESYYYKNATKGCANKRFRLAANLSLNHDKGDYAIGRINTNVNNFGSDYFSGVFDGADYNITISGTHKYNLSSDRAGGVFGYIRNSRILNLNVSGSLQTSIHAGGVIGSAYLSTIERVNANIYVVSTNQVASGLIHSGANKTKGDTDSPYSSAVKDCIISGYVKSSVNAALISIGEVRCLDRCIVIGKAESLNMDNPVKTGCTMRDGYNLPETDIYVKDFFSKGILVKGDTNLRGCFQLMFTTPKGGLTNILDLNQKANHTGLYFEHLGTIMNFPKTKIYSMQTSTDSSAWKYGNGTNIANWQAAVNNDYFTNDSNWIKGSVGTNIINNQYATDYRVLSAAKQENYYGEESYLDPIENDSQFVIVGPENIDGDVRAGVYSILDLSNMTLVSGRQISEDDNVSAGYTITWGVSNNYVSYTTDEYNEKMYLNIGSTANNNKVRISATINGNDVVNKTIYFDVTCTYAPADVVINSLQDWVTFKNAINNNTESTTYTNGTSGLSGKRVRLGADITLNYDSADYSVGTYSSSTKTGLAFKGVFDGADYTVTLNGYRQDSFGKGGMFNFTEGASIKNLRVGGSFTTNNRRAAVVCNSRSTTYERIFIDINMPKGSSYNEQYTGVLQGNSQPYYNGSTEDTTRSFAATAKDICVIANVPCHAHSAPLAYGFMKQIERCTVIGNYSNDYTDYNQGVYGAILYDYPLSENGNVIFANDIFSKMKMKGGQNDYRFVVGFRNTTYCDCKHIKNILDFNRSAVNDSTYDKDIASIIYYDTRTLDKFENIYTNNLERVDSTSNINRSRYSGTKRTFYDISRMNTFNSNWLKGSVGTPIINNQYATETKVLSAAKDENYYGGY